MIIFFINLFGLFIVYLFSQIPFNDAQVALANGIFSYTSTVGYSVTKSLVLYTAYLLVAVILGLIYYFFLKNKSAKEADLEINKVNYSKFFKIEILILIFVVFFTVFFNFYLKENALNDQLLYSEEFINLSAFNEWGSDRSFSISYPYALGNIIVIPILKFLGLSIIFYKAALNVAAVLLLYFCISLFSQNPKQRLAYFFIVILNSIYSLVIPSLHRNFFRFLLPIFILIALQLIYKKERSPKQLIFLNIILNLFILIFSSADILVIAYVIYFLYSIILFFNKTNFKSLFSYFFAPVLSLLILFSIYGLKIIYFFSSQLNSLFLYSGHINATPYFSYLKVFDYNGSSEYVRDFLFFVIFYLSILILFNIILFIILNYQKKYFIKDSFVTTLTILSAAYILYFRQNFGNANFSRVTIVSGLFIIILLILNNINLKNAHLKFIKYSSLFFLACLSFVTIYFSRYGLLSRIDLNRFLDSNAELTECSTTFLSEKLNFVDYKYCDTKILSELGKIKEVVGSDNFYVYDDTFGLYYLLNSRPVVLTPSYYMSYEMEELIINKLKNNNIKYVIYPKKLHFFGVPEEYISNADFMKLIKQYLNNQYEKKLDTESYLIYKKT